MVDFKTKERYNYADLLEIMRILRAPGGCVWDAEQTHASIRKDFLEESYEACEAIDEDDPAHLCEELGDVLLQVVFHAEIEREAGRFSMDEVCDGICKKLIYRHPHVFGSVQVASSEEVLDNWDALKRVEKSQATDTDALRAVARSLPALWRAQKLQHKAAKLGVRAAPEDTRQALRAGADRLSAANAEQAGEALGDLLFAAAGLSDALGLDSEALLNAASERFLKRFAEQEAASGDVSRLSAEEKAGLLYPGV